MGPLGRKGPSAYDFMEEMEGTSTSTTAPAIGSTRSFTAVAVPAGVKGTIAFVRTATQVHGAHSAAQRAVAIYYKTRTVATLLDAIQSSLPSVSMLVDEQDRQFALALVRTYVFAHVDKHVPGLRLAGKRKSLSPLTFSPLTSHLSPLTSHLSPQVSGSPCSPSMTETVFIGPRTLRLMWTATRGWGRQPTSTRCKLNVPWHPPLPLASAASSRT